MQRKPSNIFFTVTGRGEFPLDMLRRDECEYVTKSDGNIAVAGFVDENDPPRVVNLVMRNIDQFSCPNTRRWESFGWKVGSICKVDAALPDEEQRLEIQWSRIQRAQNNMPAAWNLSSHGHLTGPDRLAAIAANMETIAIEAQKVYDTLRRIDVEKTGLESQRRVVREFFGLKAD